jgi:hypothetical protein
LKKIIGVLFSLIIGSFVGFFGVLVSVFSDGPLKERLTVIFVILLIYFIISLLFGRFISGFTWQWGLFISIPGAALLAIYTYKEFNLLYIAYILAIIIISCTASLIGKKASRK